MMLLKKLHAVQSSEAAKQPSAPARLPGAGSMRGGETSLIKTNKAGFIFLAAFFFVLLAGFALGGAEPLAVQVSLNDAATVGVEIPVNITVNAKISADDITLPKIDGAKRLTGIVSRRYSSSYDSRRGSSTATTMSFIIQPEREGELVIPPVTVQTGRRQGRSAPYRFKVFPAGAPVTLSDGSKIDVPMGTMEIFPARKLYAGETATMILHLALPAKMSVNGATPPEVTGLNDASFVTRRSGNQVETFRFSQPRRGENGTTLLDGRAEFRLLGAGKFTPSAAMTLAVVVPQKRRSFFDDDDFFAPFTSARTVPRKVIFTCKSPVEVLPLPPPPKGAYDLGLVGTWQTECRINRKGAKTGEAVELILTASGSGGTENFRAPQLDFSGFRLYPPEVRRDENGISARYVMIPLVPGTQRLKFSVAAFNAPKSHYEVTGFDLSLNVAQGSAALPPPPQPVREENAVASSAPPVPRDDLDYQKSGTGKLVAVPLIVNSIAPSAALLLIAIILLFLSWLLPRLRGNDGKRLARSELRQKLAALRRALKAGDDPEKVCREYGVSAIAEALGLASGSTASEIAEACRENPDLHRFFTDLDASGFVPQSALNTETEGKAKSRRALLKLISRIMPLLFLFAFPLKAEELNAAFNRADYAKAISRYQSELGKNSAALSPDLLYNLGNACYRAGDLPRARIALEQAKLLAPRDAEIGNNLNFVRSALQLPADKSRITAMRDRIRPDEYLLIAAAAVALLALLILLRRRMPLSVLAALTGIVMLTLILSLCAAVAQSQSSYSSSRAILIGKSIELRTLPVANGSVSSRLAGGSDAEIIEKRGNWVRVRTNSGDGWLPAENVEEVFPYGIL